MIIRKRKDKISILISIAASLLLHSALILAILNINNKSAPSLLNTIGLEQIDQKDLQALKKKLRQAGKKNGSRELKVGALGVLAPQKSAKLANLSKKIGFPKTSFVKPVKKWRKKTKGLKLTNLSINPSSAIVIKTSQVKIQKESPEEIDQKTKKTTMTLNGHRLKEMMTPQNRNNQFSIPTKIDPFITHSDFQIRMELPEGVKLDELNKEELKYFSFQKRTIKTYISSVYKNLYDFRVSYPHVNLMPAYPDKMTGKVTFDLNGHIRRIKIIKYSGNDLVQDFFVDVLEGITLPNPPDSIVNAKQEFGFYFTLLLNS